MFGKRLVPFALAAYAASPVWAARPPGDPLKPGFNLFSKQVLVTVTRPQGLFYLVLIAPSQSYGQMQDAFQQMLDSVKFN